MRAFHTGAVLLVLAALASVAHGSRELQATAGVAIVGGAPAAPGRYPYAVQLRRWANESLSCGATLIHERILLCAAHCVVDYETGRRQDPESFHPKARIGAYFKNASPPDYELRQVVATVVHPQYEYLDRNPDPDFKNKQNYDISILLLDAPVTNKAIPKLPQQTNKPTLVVSDAGDASVYPIGWGVYDAYSAMALSNELREVALKFLSLQTCVDEYSMPMKVETDFTSPANTMFCAGNINNFFDENACFGDSGGAVVAKAANNNPADDLIVGITSFGPGDYPWCTGTPGVSTNVAQLRSWIDATMAKLLAPVTGIWTSTWTGRANNWPLVKRMDDGRTFTQKGITGRKVDILVSSAYTLTGNYNRPNWKTIGLGVVTFRWGAFRVQVQMYGSSTRVYLNGVRVLPGQSRNFGTGGSLRYGTPARASTTAVIRIPGLDITVIQPYVSRTRRLSPWLDISIRMSQAPPQPLTGAIGATFPANVDSNRDEWAGPF